MRNEFQTLQCDLNRSAMQHELNAYYIMKNTVQYVNSTNLSTIMTQHAHRTQSDDKKASGRICDEICIDTSDY